jgi:hypothetical protein
LDKGWKEPRCVDVCPTGALTFGDEDELGDLLSKTEPLLPESKTKPRVYYIGLPKRFIAGALYDPEKDECIEGAKITITENETGKKRSTLSDDFGDFWVEDLNVATFSLLIEKDGYPAKEIQSIRTQKDVHLGDIELKNKDETPPAGKC